LSSTGVMMSSKPTEQELIPHIWDLVIGVVNKLIETHDLYGFGKFQEGMNPRLDVVVKTFNVVDAMLKTLAESGQLDPDEYRQVINSRQCIYHTKRLALALDSDNQDEYDNLISLLSKQAPV
jgi:hypothetical protein